MILKKKNNKNNRKYMILTCKIDCMLCMLAYAVNERQIKTKKKRKPLK